MTIRLRIQELAEARKLSQSRLQREAGVTMTLLRRYWSNQTESVTLDALERIARVLEVQPGELLVLEVKEVTTGQDKRD